MKFILAILITLFALNVFAKNPDTLKQCGYSIDTLFILRDSSMTSITLKDIHILKGTHIYLFANEIKKPISSVHVFDTIGTKIFSYNFPFEISNVEWDYQGDILLNSNDSIIYKYDIDLRTLSKNTTPFSNEKWHILIDSNYLSYFEQSHLTSCNDGFFFFIDSLKNIYHSNDNLFLKYSYPSYLSYPEDIYISYTRNVRVNRTKIIDVFGGKLIHYSGWYNLYCENLNTNTFEILYEVPLTEKHRKEYFWKFSKEYGTHNIIGLIEVDSTKMIILFRH